MKNGFTNMLTENDKKILIHLRAAVSSQASRSVALAGPDRKSGDRLVMAGLAARTVAGRFEITMKGMEAR